MVAALQSGIIVYGLEKFYHTFSRSWVAMKNIWKFTKSKLGKKEKEVEEKKAKDIQLKIRKSSLKRWRKYYKLCMLRPVIEINSKILTSLKSCKFVSVAGDVATEFKWYYGLIRNPRVSFKAHVDSEAIQIDESFVEIHAEQNDEPASTRPGMNMDPNTNMDLLLDDDWTAQDFEVLNRRLPRSLQPRFTNPQQLNRGSCFF